MIHSAHPIKLWWHLNAESVLWRVIYCAAYGYFVFRLVHSEHSLVLLALGALCVAAIVSIFTFDSYMPYRALSIDIATWRRDQKLIGVFFNAILFALTVVYVFVAPKKVVVLAGIFGFGMVYRLLCTAQPHLEEEIRGEIKDRSIASHKQRWVRKRIPDTLRGQITYAPLIDMWLSAFIVFWIAIGCAAVVSILKNTSLDSDSFFISTFLTCFFAVMNARPAQKSLADFVALGGQRAQWLRDYYLSSALFVIVQIGFLFTITLSTSTPVSQEQYAVMILLILFTPHFVLQSGNVLVSLLVIAALIGILMLWSGQIISGWLALVLVAIAYCAMMSYVWKTLRTNTPKNGLSKFFGI
ncbi:hypothetical protein [Corynebacterium sp. sy039]|uniref:hypothetical protein n=1 Tax=Corynebacterium sp. sy039 TaxID=2599641 RepID=UPI0011B67E21|nr:hypothetical protein [Corynebacterium sp. sy039]QDZ43395.1 hypothetical protein FQV43_09755 [Corynebacterium sp. sy039]